MGFFNPKQSAKFKDSPSLLLSAGPSPAPAPSLEGAGDRRGAYQVTISPHYSGNLIF